MDDENASHVHDGKNATSLLDLPVEIFLHICSFLEAPTLVHRLSLVCKQFYLILKDDSLWKARINRISPYINYPLLQPANPDELFWKLSCVAIEKQTALWKGRFPKEKLLIANAEDATINALLLMHDGTTCIAGSYRSLLYCKLPSPGKEPSEVKDPNYIKFAHNGPICDLTAIDNTIYSCSLFDQSVKSWIFINTGLFQQRTYELNVSGGPLCVSSCPERGLFATGSYSSTIFVFDSRSGYKPITQYRPHTKSVINLAMNSEYILSTSDDKTVSVWDQRAGRTMKSIAISGEAYPTKVNMQRNWVCVVDNTSKLHLLDLKNDSELVKSYSTEHTTRITGVHMTDGCLITAGSTDRTVRFSSLTDPPQTIAKMLPKFRSICKMDYLNDTLAIAGLDHSVTTEVESYIMIWRPRPTYLKKHKKMDSYKRSLDAVQSLSFVSSSHNENDHPEHRRRRKSKERKLF